MAQKGLIVFNDNIRPVSRKYIAEKFEELKADSQLTSLEREELDFYLKDYGFELTNDSLDTKRSTLNDYTLFNYDPYGRWRLFSYSDNLFKINVSPVLGIEIGKNDGAKQTHTWNGVSLYGYLTDKIGFSFDFRDNDESGDNIDRTKSFTPETGVIVAKSSSNSIQYSEVHANISTDWAWGELTIGKDFLNWGYGESGLLVLSDKAPSFPYIRLDLRPTSWLSFNYIHGWLNSDVIDSSQSYASNYPGHQREIYRSKYFSTHTITVTPTKGLDVSLGESIIYSDKEEVSYLIPVMFFRAAQHYLNSGKDYTGSNSQFFLSISSRNNLKNTHFYSTLFIDEITLAGLFDPQRQRNQIGFTLGGSITDLPVENLTITTEYTKIYPYVYSNYFQTQTYENSSYLLGHWMGNNADLIYTSLNYFMRRGLQATIWGEYIRKGGVETALQDATQPQPPFLFGLRNNYTWWGIDVKYEIMHELFIRGKFQSSLLSSEQSNGTFIDTKAKEFLMSLYYGL